MKDWTINEYSNLSKDESNQEDDSNEFVSDE